MLDSLPETIDLIEVERELCRRSFDYFIRRAWPHIIPDPLQYNWHIGAIAEHLQAVADGQISRLLVNVPPGTSKSTLTGVMYPAWLWGPRGDPSHRFIGASHDQGLAVRDNRLMRELVMSEWYQSLWPTTLKGDQNEKLYFENAKRGFRQACAVASMTGRRGHTVAWDDPLSPEKANSETHRDTAIRVLTETLPTRLNDPASSAIIVVMQRLHERDPAGYIIAQELGYEHLCIPMEFEPERRITTSIGWTDPRTEDGELLDPVRFPEEVIARDKKTMTAHAWAGQMQQRPAPREGGLFKTGKIERLSAAPKISRRVRRWDLAATEGGGDWTAGVLLGERADGDGYVILDVQRAQKGAGGVRAMLETVAEADAKAGPVTLTIPQDPGQAGKAQRDSIAKSLAAYSPRFERETGDKETRAEPFAAQVEIGRVSVLERQWTDAFISELTTFPNGSNDDQVDAAAGGFNELVGAKGFSPSIRRGGSYYG